MVVLLTMQFHTAIMYLAQDASTRSYRIDAPHVAIALHLQGTLSPSGRSGVGVDVGGCVGWCGLVWVGVNSHPHVFVHVYTPTSLLLSLSLTYTPFTHTRHVHTPQYTLNTHPTIYR